MAARRNAARVWPPPDNSVPESAGSTAMAAVEQKKSVQLSAKLTLRNRTLTFRSRISGFLEAELQRRHPTTERLQRFNMDTKLS